MRWFYRYKHTRANPNGGETPIYSAYTYKTSKYSPHQGEQEKARRRKQMERKD